MSIADLPRINAILNGTSAVLLVAAFIAIKLRKVHLHAWLILCALTTSAAFLTCYLIYHAHAGATHVKEAFPAVSDLLRNIYLWVVLLPHTILAAAIVPMIGTSLYVAYHRNWGFHRRFSPWTFGLWLYVSVTGVIIYWMLYHLFPGIQANSVAGAIR